MVVYSILRRIIIRINELLVQTKKIVNLIYKYVSPHLNIIVIALFVLAANFYFTKVDFSLAADSNYSTIDASQAAKFVSNIQQYTPVLEEDANGFEASLLLAQSDGYVNKDLASNSLSQTEIANKDFEYAVQGGDTITTIAKKFDLHVASIVKMNSLDANNIENLKPGQKLMIPAKDLSDSQDWLAQLNQKKANDLRIAQEKQAKQLALAQAQARRSVVTRASGSSRGTSTNGAKLSTYTGSNAYPYGWCTYYAASRRSVPGQWGNASNWLNSARRSGYATGPTPTPGSIMVSSESWAGHVAYVESVNGDSFTISEMNYKGWGIVSSRTMSVNDSVVRGFIY